MTRETAINKLNWALDNNTIEDVQSAYEYIIALKMAIEALEQQPKWIPVSERLPDTDDKVLCWYEYYHWSKEKVLPEYGVGCYCKETEAWLGEVTNGRDVRVIAWQPLPKPYEPTN